MITCALGPCDMKNLLPFHSKFMSTVSSCYIFFLCVEPPSSFEFGDTSSFDDGLRRRNAPSFEAPRPRTSDEEDDEEEVEFKLAERKEEAPWFSMNRCIVAAVVLLFLGSLFLSG